MPAALSTLLPVFGLMLAGFLCRRHGVMGPTAASELNRFVVWLGLPALLFKIIAASSWAELYQPGFVAAFGLATALVFIAVFVARWKTGRPMADAGVDAVAASYSNTGYIGIPLAMLMFGAGSQTHATIASLIVVCALFSVAVVVIETGVHGGSMRLRTCKRVAISLSKNPLILAPAAGVIVATADWTMPKPLESFLDILAAAASPAALVSLGLFLAEKQSGQAKRSVPIVLAVAKLVALPAAAWYLAVSIFEVPHQTANMAVLMAALPTGTGPFMLAEFYKREAAITSQTILWSTVLSLFTLSVLMTLLA